MGVTEASPAVNSNSLLLNLPSASAVVGLTVWQLRGLIANDEIPVIRIGKKLYVNRKTLEKWAQRAESRYKPQHVVRRAKVSA